jgi:methyl-accepting chemotaxis protein
VRFGFTRQPNRIYFWERIAFRVSVGFIFPVLCSAYALFYVSSVHGELWEFEERVQRMWNSIHMSENKTLLSLAKARMNAQGALASSDPQLIRQLESEQKELQLDLDSSRRMVEKIAAENQIEPDASLLSLYSQAEEVRTQMSGQVEEFGAAVRRQNGPDSLAAKREVDRYVSLMEKALGKVQAAREVQELKVVDLIQEGRTRTTRVLWFFLSAVLFFGIAAAAFVTISITAPVKEILNRVKDIATGDGDLSKRVFVRSGGELKELADWMNVFLGKTEKIIATISNASEVVRQTTDQVGRHASLMNVATSGISKNMMEQSMNLDECTGSVSSIDDLLQNSGESTRQAASLSKIAMDRALQGGASVHETIEAMEKIEETSRKIEVLVSSITDIASQTNLLAINAAIEATKAGDHGKGFAVVAEEVRKLAERARKLTGEVTSLMNESGVRVKAGVGLAKGAGVSLDGIIKDVEAVSSLIQRIAAASSKQAESSSTVLEFMQKVSDAVRTNLAEVQEVTKATESTALEVNKLDSLVAQLNQVVHQFQVAEEEAAGSLGLPAAPEEADSPGAVLGEEDTLSFEHPEGLAPLPLSAAPPPLPSVPNPLPPALPGAEGREEMRMPHEHRASHFRSRGI